MSKYLEFRKFLNPTERKTNVIDVLNKAGDFLGTIQWKSTWRKYCYYNLGEYTWYDSNCLMEIVKLLDKLNKEHKERRIK